VAELTIFAGIDSYMEGITNPNVNYGSDTQIRLGASYVVSKTTLHRGIGNFDVSALAGEPIVSAKMVRHIVAVTNGGFASKLSRCTRPATWTEAGVTWNKYDGVTNWTAGGGDFDDTGPPAKVDYTEPTAIGLHEIVGLESFVEDALANRGGIVSLILRATNEAPGATQKLAWYAKESGVTYRWQLVVAYGGVGAFNMRNYW